MLRQRGVAVEYLEMGEREWGGRTAASLGTASGDAWRDVSDGRQGRLCCDVPSVGFALVWRRTIGSVINAQWWLMFRIVYR